MQLIKETIPNSPIFFQGYIDYIDNSYIRGWALGIRNGQSFPVRIGCFVDGRLESIADAVTYRVDLDQPSYLSGKVGFEFINSEGNPDAFFRRCELHILTESGVAAFKLPAFTPPRKSTFVEGREDSASKALLAKKRPLFIIGAARSGTSVFHQVLAKCTGLASFNEGHLLPLSGEIDQTVRNYRERDHFITTMATALVPDSFWENALVAYFQEIHKQLYAGQGWIDKTPGSEMIAAVPFAIKCWPNAKFVFMRRRGIEVVRSGLRKFPHFSFEELCGEWALCFEQWSAIKTTIKEAWIEIDQFDMLTKPFQVAESVAAFAELTDDQKQEFVELIQNYFPERTSEIGDMGACALKDTGWTALQQSYFQDRCGAMMEAYGYGMDATYYRLHDGEAIPVPATGAF